MHIEREMQQSAIDWIEKTLSKDVDKIQKINKGANNRIYKVSSKDENSFIFKEYFSDDRNRLNREYNAFDFLHKIGVNDVPISIAKDEKNNFALYNYVAGEIIKPNQLTHSHIDKILLFVTKIQSISPNTVGENFQDAIFATNSFQEFIETIQFRINRFTSYLSFEDISQSIKSLIKHDDLCSRLNEQISKFEKEVPEIIQKEKSLSLNDKRLSPVDFGPHNMIVDVNNNISFIDFEYFGWDDPVKLIPNLIYHEGSRGLQPEIARYLLEKYLSISSSQPQIVDRIDIALQLAAMDWLSILLWGITPEKISQRVFSDPNMNIDDYTEKQLKKILLRLNELENPKIEPN